MEVGLLPVLQFGGCLQWETVLVHQVDVAAVLSHRGLPLFKLGSQGLGSGRVLQRERGQNNFMRDNQVIR